MSNPTCEKCGRGMVSNGRPKNGVKQFKCRPCRKWKNVTATVENGDFKNGDRGSDGPVSSDVYYNAASGIMKTASVSEINGIEDACNRVGLKSEDYHIEEIYLKPYTQGQKGPDGKPVILQLMSAQWKLTPKVVGKVGLRPVEVNTVRNKYGSIVHRGVGESVGASVARGGEPETSDFNGSKTTLVFGDMHFGFSNNAGSSGRDGGWKPFHDDRALNVMLKIARDAGIDSAVCLGDALDFTEFTTKWLLRPEHDGTTQRALVECAQFFAEVRSIVDDGSGRSGSGSGSAVGVDVGGKSGVRGSVTLIEGNHEKRLWENLISGQSRSMFVLRRADEPLEPLVTVSGLLGLKKLGVEYAGSYPEGYPKGRVWINDHLVAVHGSVARGAGGGSAWATLSDLEKSVLFGHIHRIEHVSRTYHSMDKVRVRGAWGIGCLCWCDGRIPSAKAEERWQQGFAIVTSNGGGAAGAKAADGHGRLGEAGRAAGIDDERFSVEQVHVVDGVAMWRGNTYVA